MIDLDRTITLEHAVRSQASRLTELEQRLAVLERDEIVMSEWDEAFPPIRLNEATELAGMNV